jgi:hypothetical protein
VTSRSLAAAYLTGLVQSALVPSGYSPNQQVQKPDASTDQQWQTDDP